MRKFFLKLLGLYKTPEKTSTEKPIRELKEASVRLQHAQRENRDRTTELVSAVLDDVRRRRAAGGR